MLRPAQVLRARRQQLCPLEQRLLLREARVPALGCAGTGGGGGVAVSVALRGVWILDDVLAWGLVLQLVLLLVLLLLVLTVLAVHSRATIRTILGNRREVPAVTSVAQIRALLIHRFNL